MNDTSRSRNGLAGPEFQIIYVEIPPGQLDFPKELFDERSFAKMEESDLLVPMVVRQTGSRYVVIDGCKRLLYALGAGLSFCRCALLDPPPGEHPAGLLRIRLNRGRALDFYEKLIFVRWLRTNAGPSADDAGIFGDSRERFAYERLASCSAEVIDAVASGKIDMSLAPEAEALCPSDRKAFVRLANRLSFTKQMQREILDWLPELAFRNKCPMSELIDSPWMSEILANEKFNAPQKIERVRAAIFERRFPTLARAKKKWSEKAAMLNPDPSHVLFKPSEAFERNRLELRINLTSAGQAQSILSGLARIDADDWNRLIYPAQLYSSKDDSSG